MEQCHKNHWQFMVVLKDDSLSSVWEEFSALLKLTPETNHSQTWGTRRQQFKWVNRIEYDYGAGKGNIITVHVVTCDETWEAVNEQGEIVTKQSLAHVFNTLARFSSALAPLFREMGARGFIAFVYNTLTGPWLVLEEVKQRLNRPFQLRLE